MKALILTLALFFSTQTQAGQLKNLLIMAEEEIIIHYHADTDYRAEKVYNYSFVPAPIDEIHVGAQVDIRNAHTGKLKTEFCLVEFEKESLDILGLICH